MRTRRRESGERMHRLTNRVRPYAWGARAAIPSLLGTEPDGSPQAELWLGAHHGAPSTAHCDDGPRPLPELISEDPYRVLGPGTAERFGARLPYLLKYLAAEAPLSLQVHPDAERARSGFEAEERAGIPVDAPHRNYRDPHHKPELLLALEPFEALCGFREPAATAADEPELVMAYVDGDTPARVWYEPVGCNTLPFGTKAIVNATGHPIRVYADPICLLPLEPGATIESHAGPHVDPAAGYSSAPLIDPDGDRLECESEFDRSVKVALLGHGDFAVSNLGLGVGGGTKQRVASSALGLVLAGMVDDRQMGAGLLADIVKVSHQVAHVDA